MKTELEEAAEKYIEEYMWEEEQDPWFDFMEGAKWQMDKQEEFAIGFAEWCLNYIPENIITSKQLLEIYKKEKGL
jgi:hypothetical protein